MLAYLLPMLVVVKHKRQARQNKIAADTDHPTLTQLTVQILPEHS